MEDDTWSPQPTMTTWRAALGAATGPDGRIYAFGGVEPGAGQATATAEALNPGARSTLHIRGTPGDDAISGTPHADVICAGAETDVVRERGGDDLIRGRAGNDELDAADGGPSRDVCPGDAGDLASRCRQSAHQRRR